MWMYNADYDNDFQFRMEGNPSYEMSDIIVSSAAHWLSWT